MRTNPPHALTPPEKKHTKLCFLANVVNKVQLRELQHQSTSAWACVSHITNDWKWCMLPPRPAKICWNWSVSQHACCPRVISVATRTTVRTYVMYLLCTFMDLELRSLKIRHASQRNNSIMSRLAPVVSAMNHPSVDLFCLWIPHKVVINIMPVSIK